MPRSTSSQTSSTCSPATGPSVGHYSNMSCFMTSLALYRTRNTNVAFYSPVLALFRYLGCYFLATTHWQLFIVVASCRIAYDNIYLIPTQVCFSPAWCCFHGIVIIITIYYCPIPPQSATAVSAEAGTEQNTSQYSAIIIYQFKTIQ